MVEENRDLNQDLNRDLNTVGEPHWIGGQRSLQQSLRWLWRSSRQHVRQMAIAITTVAIAGCGGDGASDRTPQTVTIMGSITGEGSAAIEQVFAPFTEETGIEVVYEGTDAFATLLPVRVDSGNPPDLALFPQPGLMRDLAVNGHLIPVDSFLDAEQIAAAYGDDWVQLGSFDQQVYGLWARADIKSLVWYQPDEFEAQGYTIPTTWQELRALESQIMAEGGVPWCIGMESGAATGWVGTDWVEDILLRQAGPEVYDQWVNHEIPFTHPAVAQAFETFGEIARDPQRVLGGPVGVISTPFGDSPQPLFDDPPGCYLHRQTNFISTFFPEDVTVADDADIFLLPAIDDGAMPPILVAGTAFAMLSDRPEVKAVVEYLLTPEPHEIWVGLENYVSPHQQVNLDAYADDFTRTQAKILAAATTVRFDGSDLMPGTVGTGTFWTGMVNYVGGTDLETVLQAIEDSWPEATAAAEEEQN